MNQFKSMCLLVLLVAVTASHATEYTVTKQVYFDVTIGDEDAGRIVIGLFGDIAPKTVANFIAIATDGIDGKTFAGTKFHRVISKFMIQGGDVDKGDGSGSISIYGKYFDDETFKVKHTGPGFISMANAGKNTNGCQFFITTIATPWLDGKHTAFGKVIKGQAIVHKIELTKTDADDHPLQPIVIKECGLLETTKPFQVSDDIYDIWAWVHASAVPLGMSFSILFLFHWILRKINASEASIEKEINECLANKSKTE